MTSNPFLQIKFKIQSFFNNLKRRLFFSSRNKRKGKRSSKVNQRSLAIKIRRINDILKARTILLALSVLFFFFLLLNINQYFSIKVQTYGDSDYAPKLINAQDSNVMLIGYEEDSNGYRYINFLYFVASQGGVLRGFAIDPSFVLKVNGKYVQMSTLLSAYEEDTIESTVTRIEYEFGIRVDRYISFDSNKLEKFFNSKYSSKLGSAYAEGINSPDTSFKYRAEIQHKFVSDTFSSFSSIREKLYNFWKVDEFADIIQTNYSKREFINFLLIFDSDLKATVEITDNYGILDTSGYYRVNTLLFDEILNDKFRDLRIVTEQCEVEVYNASKTTGLASQKSRELQIAGANVVKSGNYFEDVNLEDVSGVVFVNSNDDLKRYRYTIQLIEQSLRGNILIKVGEYEYNQTGDLILVLL